MQIVSYYTPTYRDTAHRYLIPSCKSLGLDLDVREVDCLGSWDSNTRYKAEFLRRMREAYIGPIVWLDADAEVVKQPIAFDVLDDYDVAFHRFAGRELLSGTLWLGDTDYARALLDKWCKRCEQKPSQWDQKSLDDAVGRVHGLAVHELPAEYCFIFDLSRRLHPNADPVIVHHQASRTLKEFVR